MARRSCCHGNTPGRGGRSPMNWTYDQTDPSVMLFTQARERFGFDLPEGARVLELGCAETDFLERLKKQNPSFDLWGVDVRKDRDANGWTFVHADAASMGGIM